MLVEICANSFESALNAQQGGADRIELCQELGLGGLTPSYGLLKKTLERLTIPVFVLIRPRSGNFEYTSEEFEVMLEDIALCKKMGCAGIVSGVLNEDFTINAHRTKVLLDASAPMQFTFHRAFDQTPDAAKALAKLASIGCHRLLTSGHHTSAEKGLQELLKLREASKNKPIVMPGGGINLNNIKRFKEHGFEEIHFSASTIKIVEREAPKISMNNLNFISDTAVRVSATELIEKMIAKVK